MLLIIQVMFLMYLFLWIFRIIWKIHKKCQSSEGRGATATRTIHCSGVLSIRRNFYAGLRYYRVCEDFTVPDNHTRLWNVVSNAT